MKILNDTFKHSLDEALRDLELIILIEHICNNLETINEEFRESYRKQKDIDWYSGSIVISKRKLDHTIALISSKIQRRGGDDEEILKRFFRGVIEDGTAMALAAPLTIEIITGKGTMNKIIIGVGVVPESPDMKLSGSHRAMDWSPELDEIFGRYFNLSENFRKQHATAPLIAKRSKLHASEQQPS